jgi:hypothetical protein
MKLEVVNTSVVLVGQEYPGALLTPEFLKNAKIAKRNWELIEPPVITPIASVVKYSNGLVFIGEPNRIQILSGNPKEIDIASLADIVTKVVQKLAYVRHTAAGVNITGFIEHSQATQFLLDRFVKQGFWTDEQTPKEVKLALTYPADEVMLTLNYASGAAKLAPEQQKKDGIVVTANYHMEISISLTLEASVRVAKAAISRIEERHQHFQDFVTKSLEMED